MSAIRRNEMLKALELMVDIEEKLQASENALNNTQVCVDYLTNSLHNFVSVGSVKAFQLQNLFEKRSLDTHKLTILNQKIRLLKSEIYILKQELISAQDEIRKKQKALQSIR